MDIDRDLAEQDRFPIEGTTLHLTGIDAPAGFWECAIGKREAIIKKNWRGILQLFGIRVYVYPDHVQVNGLIPPQVISVKEALEDPHKDAIIPLALGKGEVKCNEGL
jgi:hypothetical protein